MITAHSFLIQASSRFNKFTLYQPLIVSLRITFSPGYKVRTKGLCTEGPCLDSHMEKRTASSFWYICLYAKKATSKKIIPEKTNINGSRSGKNNLALMSRNE